MLNLPKRRDILAGLAALLVGDAAVAQPAPAVTPTAPPPAAATPATADPAAVSDGPAPAPATPNAAPTVKLPRVALTTTQGVIVIELARDKAPITAGNFLRYAEQKRFDGTVFYRASTPPGMHGQGDYGSIQGGTQNDPARILKPIAHEPTTRTGLHHTDGVISMGRNAPGTATGDFFICVGDQTYLDANPKAKPADPGFAAFGHVVEGMEVVRKILALPVSATGGVGAMKGEMLAKPVKIVSARRVG